MNKQDILGQHIEGIINFVKICCEDQDKSEEVLSGLIGLIGDLGQAFGNKLIGFLSDKLIVKTVQEGTQFEDVAKTARWTQGVSWSLA